MKAIISNFRQGRHTIKHSHMIIHVEGVSDKKNAETLIGKKVSWQAPGQKKKVLTGRIASAHGRKGAVRAIFEKGLPGQSIGKEIKIE